MAGKTSFPVLSRIRCSGTVYAPDTEKNVIELNEKEAARLMSLGSIGVADDAEDGEDGATIETKFDLKVALVALIAEGHDIKSMDMNDISPLLGDNRRGVRRKHVNDALAEIEKEAAE